MNLLTEFEIMENKFLFESYLLSESNDKAMLQQKVKSYFATQTEKISELKRNVNNITDQSDNFIKKSLNIIANWKIELIKGIFYKEDEKGNYKANNPVLVVILLAVIDNLVETFVEIIFRELFQTGKIGKGMIDNLMEDNKELFSIIKSNVSENDKKDASEELKNNLNSFKNKMYAKEISTAIVNSIIKSFTYTTSIMALNRLGITKLKRYIFMDFIRNVFTYLALIWRVLVIKVTGTMKAILLAANVVTNLFIRAMVKRGKETEAFILGSIGKGFMLIIIAIEMSRYNSKNIENKKDSIINPKPAFKSAYES